MSAIWPPAGLGIAALYVFGLRWWPGIFFGELLVNGHLLLEKSHLPLGSVLGQWAGNLAEVIIGAWLLRRLLGERAALDRASQVGLLIIAAGVGTSISATVGTISMLAGNVIDAAEIPMFWRTWFLGDTAGALVVLPLALAWLADPHAAWRRVRTAEGAAVVALVALLSALAVGSDAPVTYLVFPALIWAAFRLGPPGVTLCNAILAAITIGITAERLGVFYKQPIDNRTLSTQLYILIASMTALFLSTVVSERRRSIEELAEEKSRGLDRTRDDRRRIARELHDSVSQSLFSSGLHARAAKKLVDDETLRGYLTTIEELTKSAQSEMRRFIFEWGPDGIGDGLVPALARHIGSLGNASGVRIELHGPAQQLPLTPAVQSQLYGIAREALANVLRHAGARTAQVRVYTLRGRITLEVADDGCGFDATPHRNGHFGLESMQSRSTEVGGELCIVSASGRGTVVRVHVPANVV